MDLVRDPYTGEMVDRRTGLPPARSPGAVTPKRVRMVDQLLAGAAIPARVNAMHSLFNPVTGLQEAGQHSVNMLSPGRAPMQRVSDLGQIADRHGRDGDADDCCGAGRVADDKCDGRGAEWR